MINYFMENQATAWIIAGFTMLAIEAFAFGFAIGVLLFGGLGAILTGALLWLGIVPDNFVAATACFALCTAAITALSWSPLKRLQSGADLGNDRSSDLIGHTLTLSTDISTTSPGSHKYSGINWRLEPATTHEAQTISAGTQVQVSAVSVGVFFVEPVISDK